jgi:peptidoglycan/xylan/chitin deacetylase (PgdA/CDA1 family)
VIAAILLYHRVTVLDRDAYGLSVRPEQFHEQMTRVRRGFTPVPLEDVITGRTSANGSPHVAVTFDDGYIDTLTTASPILGELGIPATFFVTTERLDDPAYRYWWDRVAELPARTPMHRSLVEASVDERDRLLRDLPASVDAAPPTDRRMTADELRVLAARPGHSIGAHSSRHLFLPAQTSAVQREEIELSAATVGRVVGQRPSAFAYPFGGRTAETTRLVQEAGFRGAVTTEEALVDATTDRFALPRFEVTAARSAHFAEWLESVFDGG